MNTIEIIGTIAIIINTGLQIRWYIWSRSVHDRKHSTDEENKND